MDNVKTVYILGAGASAAVGLPIQNKLIEKIFTLTYEDIPESENFLSEDTLNNTLNSYYEYFEVNRRYLADFLIQCFSNNELKNYYYTYKSQISKPEQEKIFNSACHKELWKNIYMFLKEIVISLEDVFTTLDKVKINNDSYGIFTSSNIDLISTSLKNCIIYVLSFFIAKSKNSSTLYNTISKFFISQRIQGNDQNPFSIISLNWDTLLDSYIYKACLDHNRQYPMNQLYPDYCFYNYDLSHNLPSTLIKAKGFLNIKIMKLHGSINWLECPNCGRIYTDFNNLISLKSLSNHLDLNDGVCECCSSLKRSSFTQSIIITPTFLKTFSSHYLKNIWHNAYLDLCKASEVVFIGYSLPDADFELKYILKKAIKPDCKITVILHQNDNPKYYEDTLKNNLNVENSEFISILLNRLSLPEHRYKNFFPNNYLSFDYNGIDSYFTQK